MSCWDAAGQNRHWRSKKKRIEGCLSCTTFPAMSSRGNSPTRSPSIDSRHRPSLEPPPNIARTTVPSTAAEIPKSIHDSHSELRISRGIQAEEARNRRRQRIPECGHTASATLWRFSNVFLAPPVVNARPVPCAPESAADRPGLWMFDADRSRATIEQGICRCLPLVEAQPQQPRVPEHHHQRVALPPRELELAEVHLQPRRRLETHHRLRCLPRAYRPDELLHLRVPARIPRRTNLFEQPHRGQPRVRLHGATIIARYGSSFLCQAVSADHEKRSGRLPDLLGVLGPARWQKRVRAGGRGGRGPCASEARRESRPDARTAAGRGARSG